MSKFVRKVTRTHVEFFVLLLNFLSRFRPCTLKLLLLQTAHLIVQSVQYPPVCLKSVNFKYATFLASGCTGLQVEELYTLDDSAFENLRCVVFRIIYSKKK